MSSILEKKMCILTQMNINEGKLVFNYLEKKHTKISLFRKNKAEAKRLAYIEYDELTEGQKKSIVKNLIISYLVDNVSHSLTFSWVNGSPEKRRMRILEYVNSKYNKMDSEEREIIVEKILDNYNRS